LKLRRCNLLLKSLDERELIIKVCKLYYLENKTQNEIAKIVGISRPKVSRLLAAGREMGIVKIEIDTGSVLNDEEETSELLVEKFNLKNVVIVDCLSQRKNISSIATAAAKFLSSYIKDGQIIGVSWGRTLYQTCERIVFNGRYNNTLFVPLLGGVGQFRYQYQMNSIVEKMANAFHAMRYYLHAPAVLENPAVLEIMLQDNSIKLVTDMWDKLDLAIVGIGEPISLSNAFKDIFDQEFLANLIKAQAVGDIAGRFFTADGTECKNVGISMLGISLDQLKKTPEVIGVAGGKEKVPAIYAAIKARYINSLITDLDTALSILKMEEKLYEDRGSNKSKFR